MWKIIIAAAFFITGDFVDDDTPYEDMMTGPTAPKSAATPPSSSHPASPVGPSPSRRCAFPNS